MASVLCEKLFKEMVFYSDVHTGGLIVRPCCIHLNLVVPSFATKDVFDPEAYLKFVRKTHEELQGKTTLCRKCGELVERSGPHDDGRREFRLQTVRFLTNFGVCNCRCLYCIQAEESVHTKKYNLPVMPILEALAARHQLGGLKSAVWLGGEPVLAIDFAAASEYLRERGVFQLFFTNATVYSPQIARSLAEGNGRALVSLDSGSRKTYRLVKGLDAFDAVLKNLRLYRQTASDADRLILKYVMIEENAKHAEIDGFFDLCEDLDIRQVSYSFDYYPVRHDHSYAPDASILDALDYFFTEADKRNLSSFLYANEQAKEPLRQKLIERTRAELARKTPALAGRELVFWGGGEAYAAYAELFTATKPLALLQTLSSSSASSGSVTLPAAATLFGAPPVLGPERFFEERPDGERLPFVCFCKRENRKMLAENLKPWLDRREGDALWCVI